MILDVVGIAFTKQIFKLSLHSFRDALYVNFKRVLTVLKDVVYFFKGVDDNGSGMAALFEIGRLMAESRDECKRIKRVMKNTVILVAFAAEERVRAISCIVVF